MHIVRTSVQAEHNKEIEIITIKDMVAGIQETRHIPKAWNDNTRNIVEIARGHHIYKRSNTRQARNVNEALRRQDSSKAPN